ncbi:aminodeoxychorismate synthase, component I [Bacillus luteus]|uniref:Aminodeoxychorismate synthase, component I n=2 Tax=Alkalicoccus luteus TaxID=1237094 RepID=A0A969TWS4_9BACI|nr:aminodeoxychorismate synthase, component I [Alkalicoccus luteus]
MDVQGRSVPTAADREPWFETYKKLSRRSTNHLLLESGRGGRFSFMGLNPVSILQGKNGRLTVTEGGEETVLNGPILESLRSWLRSYTAPKRRDLPDFQGGIAGQFSYDLIREIESLPNEAADDLATDDVLLLAFQELYVIDHQEEKRWCIAVGAAEELDQKLTQMEAEWQKAASERFDGWRDAAPASDDVHRSMDEARFAEAVTKTKDYIAAGDVFQVNLSVRETRKQTTEPLHIYEHLRSMNPSPYMGFLQTEELTYVSASPELLVKIKDDEVSTRPIAGTRSRGRDDAEDRRLAETLLANEKERAEHIMLVDLERNDLGRVSEYGTVEVNELMVIEKYSHVQHIVSNVRGTKRADCDALDVIAATFPGGTITGAPKIRTMEIIEELEPVRRGAYTGAMGWIGWNGDMELNITIRTMIVKDGQLHVQAGAGIVIDSEPRAEYRESLKKAAALWRALEMSEAEAEEQRRISK